MSEPASEKFRSIYQAIEHSDLKQKQALAYCAELSLIRAMPEFRLTVGKKKDTRIGTLPTLVTIERV